MRPETELRILTPVIGMSKAEIVRQGRARTEISNRLKG